MADVNYVGTRLGSGHIEKVARSILFQGWENDMLKQFLTLTHPEVRHYYNGSNVFQEDDTANGMYVILNGRVGIYKFDSEGIERELLHKASPWSLGEAAVFGELKRNATVRTIESNTQLMFVHRRAIESLSAHQEVLTSFYKGLAHELYRGQSIGNARLKDALTRESHLEERVKKLSG